MADYVISCCSTADLTHEHFVQRDIQYICFHFALDGVDFPDDLGRSIAFPDFYKAMADGAETRTSQVNVSEFEEYFSRFAAEGKDVLHMTLSSGISGVINSAQSAAEIVMEKYPGRKIVILDSLGASSGYGLFMDGLADQRDAGMPFDELCAWAEAHRLNLHHWFFSTTREYYVKGGRISKAAGWFGGLLNICPLLNMDAEHLPAAEHGRSRPAHPAREDPRQEEGHQDDRRPHGRARRGRRKLQRQVLYLQLQLL